ncbi:hypothetical protein HOY80DRAFT_1038581 [Tuber brumale]|nr:hypothetical protein HOY80DRAFT_1038581 [Tuber brumale]
MYHQTTHCLFCSDRFHRHHHHHRRLRYQFRECPHACCKRCMRNILAHNTATDILGQTYFACPKCARSVHGAGRLRRGWSEWVERVVDREERERRFCVVAWSKVGEMAEDMGRVGRVWKFVWG